MDQTLSFADDRLIRSRFVAPDLVLCLRADEPQTLGICLSLGEISKVVIGRGTESRFWRQSVDGVPTLLIEVADRRMSSRHATITRRREGAWLRDVGSKNGSYIGGQTLESERLLCESDVIELGSTFFVFRAAVERSARSKPDTTCGAGALCTLSRELAYQLEQAVHLFAGGSPLLIYGETGTGKEVFAQTLHQRASPRQPWIAVNCGALPHNLVESELFGHKKGAFSGASENRQGLVRAAHGGTLFLDEIGELALVHQVKLLRVLQEQEVTPVGGERPIAVDVRVVAATHRNIPAMIERGEFREDLYARLAGAEYSLMPLRQRLEDVGVLAGRILSDLGGQRALSRAAARKLFAYSWPRNVRELEQVLRRAYLKGPRGRDILPAEIELEVASSVTSRIGKNDQELRLRLQELLNLHAGNVSQVARELGKARIQIRRWCQRLAIDIESYRQ